MRKSILLISIYFILAVSACITASPSPPDSLAEIEVKLPGFKAEAQAATPTPPATDLSFFPVGFMGPGDTAALPDIAQGGFNVVYEFRSIQEIDEAEAYLEQAEAAGLKVIQNMPACRAYDSDEPVCEEWQADVWSETEWAEFITTLARHDNLVAWFLPDEMTDYQAAANLYRWVQQYDPHRRPVYGNPGTFEFDKIVRFPAFSDFLWAACYPEYYREPRAIVTYGMRLDAQASRDTNNRWGAILQFFDSADFDEDSSYPTARELRADSYQAIIGGATGLWYFNYEMGRDLEGLLAALEVITAEIVGAGGLEAVILAPAVPQTVTKQIIAGPQHSPPAQGEVYDSIQLLQKEKEDTYLFAVNIATEPVVVKFDNLPSEVVAAELLFEDRTVPVVAGSFMDTFIQDDVHIYRLLTANQPN